MKVDLSLTDSRGYEPGASFSKRALWLLVEAAIMLNPAITPYSIKRWVLRKFGAQIGKDVIIKPNVHIKYPWNLTIGDNCWIGERSWIDNLGRVEIGDNVCISQGAYLCTGNHDWADPGMGLVVKPIRVEAGAWLGAFSKVGPGITIGEESIVTLGSVALKSTEPRGIYTGNPAVKVGRRSVRDIAGPKAADSRRVLESHSLEAA